MINEVRGILLENNVPFTEPNESICVEPETENGFEVWFMEDGDRAYVSCRGWHDEFEDKEDAKNCFLNALTNHVRIVATAKGSFEYKWEYQYLEGSSWQSHGLTGLLLFPFWRKSTDSIYSNNWL